MRKVVAIWELMRLEHGLMLCIAVVIGSLIALGGIPQYQSLIFACITVLFLEASTFALNDYYDRDVDRKNNRTDRPLVRGDISPKTAIIIFMVLFPLGILSSVFVNSTCFLIASITGVLALIYDSKLKKIKLLGNFYIAYTMAIPFVFGGAAVLRSSTFSVTIPPVIFVLALIAFCAGAGREIMKDVMDVAGDTTIGVRSFPLYIGIRGSNALAAILYLVAIVLSFIPFFMRSYTAFFYDFSYLFFILITDSLLLTTAVHLVIKKKPNMRFYRKFTLAALFIGLVGFLAGAFVV
jgi:geranylgeranylglycerol-phosphate geranylgeranyltransferase